MDSKSSFNMKLPYGWEDQTVHIFRGPEEDEYRHSLMLVVDRHLQHKDISGFAREKIDPIMAGLQGADVLKDEEITIPGGNLAHEFVYKWVPGEGQAVIVKYVFALKEGLGFSFSATFTKKTYQTVGAGLAEIIDAILPGTYHPEEE